MKSNNIVYLSVVAVVAIFIFGLGTGVAVNTFISSQGSSQPYELTLVITTNNTYNATVGAQPAYFVLQNGALKSSAVINLTAHRLIELTIINYDDGNDTVPAAYANVTGTQNNQILVVGNNLMNATENTNGISLTGAETVSSLPLDYIAHTFTSTALGLNIPVAPSSTEHATLYFNETGTFYWRCMVSCGSGSQGWDGAMLANGWMQGDIVLS